MEKRFRVAQKVMIVNDKNQVLVVRFSTDKDIPTTLHGKWDFPGGGLEQESLSDGLMREVREELGEVKISKIEILSVTKFPLEKNDDECVAIVYSGQWGSGTITLSNEHDMYQWLSFDDAKNLDYGNDDFKRMITILADRKIKGGQ